MLGDDTLMALLMSDGRRQIVALCADCGHKSTAVPQRLLTRPLDEYPIYQDNTGRYEAKPECAVVGCTDQQTEFHHFAPGAVFSRELTDGERQDLGWYWYESDLWPTAYLCVIHHREWHERMIGYRWNRPQVKAS
jgi:hypothetical protein